MHPIDAAAPDGIIIALTLFALLAVGRARLRLQARLEAHHADRQAWAELGDVLDAVWADVDAVR